MYSIPVTELEKKDPEILDKLCPPDCEHLSPTEHEQDRSGLGYVILKGPHRCKKFDVQVRHKFAHPHIYKTEDCTK